MDILSLVVGLFVGWLTLYVGFAVLGFRMRKQARAEAEIEKQKLAESLQKLQQVKLQMDAAMAIPRGKARREVVQ